MHSLTLLRLKNIALLSMKDNYMPRQLTLWYKETLVYVILGSCVGYACGL